MIKNNGLLNSQVSQIRDVSDDEYEALRAATPEE